MELQPQNIESLIHVGSKKIPKSIVKEIKELFKDDVESIFQIFSVDKLQEKTKDKIINILFEEAQKYAFYYMTLPDNNQPILKLSGLANISLIKQQPGKGTEYGFDVNNISQSNRILTAYIHLNDIDRGGEIEFFYQNLKIQPSKNEIIIFPAYFTHMHKLNASPESKYFIKATFFIGG